MTQFAAVRRAVIKEGQYELAYAADPEGEQAPQGSNFISQREQVEHLKTDTHLAAERARGEHDDNWSRLATAQAKYHDYVNNVFRAVNRTDVDDLSPLEIQSISNPQLRLRAQHYQIQYEAIQQLRVEVERIGRQEGWLAGISSASADALRVRVPMNRRDEAAEAIAQINIRGIPVDLQAVRVVARPA